MAAVRSFILLSLLCLTLCSLVWCEPEKTKKTSKVDHDVKEDWDMEEDDFFEKSLEEALGDVRLSRDIIAYFDTVPTDHRIKKHANRVNSLIAGDSRASKLFFPKAVVDLLPKVKGPPRGVPKIKSPKTTNSTSPLKAVISKVVQVVYGKDVLEGSRDGIGACGPCRPCPDVDSSCVTCPNCVKDCPVCNVPSSCPIIGEKRCPPRPSCPECNKKPTKRPQTTEKPKVTKSPTTTEKPETTNKPRSTKRPAATEKPRITKKPKPTKKPKATKAPKEPTKKPTKKPTPPSRPKASKKPKSTNKPKTKAPKRGTTKAPFTESPDSTEGDEDAEHDRRRRDVQEPPVVAGPDSGCECICNGSPKPVRMRRTYQQLMESAKPLVDPIITPTNRRLKAITMSQTATNSIGLKLYEDTIDQLLNDDQLREHFKHMIDSIPRHGDSMGTHVAEPILLRLGENASALRPPKDSQLKGTYTYMTPREYVKAIIGFIFDAIMRRQCHCKVCPIRELCPDCQIPPPFCEDTECEPCPDRPKCPAPPECRAYPACKICPVDPNDDGDDPKLLDETDHENPVTEQELSAGIPCIGSTCDPEDQCGLAPSNPLTPAQLSASYMSGGEDQKYGEWPSFVRILYGDSSTRVSHCGGVLISRRHVLTAAHCLRLVIGPTLKLQIQPEDLTVVIGEHNATRKDSGEVTRKVVSMCRSNKTDIREDIGSRYDFAILKLDNDVAFGEKIQSACLPYEQVKDDETSQCYVIGLGVTRIKSQLDFTLPTVVQKMRVHRTTCKAWGFRHDDRSRHCFTKNGGKGDSCTGDSGGPILCLSSKKRWTVHGLVSYGSEFCDGTESTGWTGVYTRVRALLEQIREECEI